MLVQPGIIYISSLKFNVISEVHSNCWDGRP